MQIQLYSDIHLEFMSRVMNLDRQMMDSWKTDADVLVVAGDFSVGFSIVEQLSYLCSLYPHVVYVPGNHEYYMTNQETLFERLQEAQDKNKNLHWLNDSFVEIDGQRFIGGTLWFEETQLSSDFWNQRKMSDFLQIKDFMPFDWNDKTVRFLQKNIKENDIVVTHHLPSYQCVAERFKNSNLNCFFANDLDHIFRDNKPKYWFFGHTHDSVDLMIENTRVVANPYGYWGHELNPNFKSDFIVEV